jgi:hypothetical protein
MPERCPCKCAQGTAQEVAACRSIAAKKAFLPLSVCTFLSHARAKLTLSDTGSFFCCRLSRSRAAAALPLSFDRHDGLHVRICDVMAQLITKIIKMDTNGRPDHIA